MRHNRHNRDDLSAPMRMASAGSAALYCALAALILAAVGLVQ